MCEDQQIDYDMSDSMEDETDQLFRDSMMVATLAERFNSTQFKEFQTEVISHTFSGRDTLVVQPTRSGKSLCFEFPPVYQQKKAIVIVPTISLMEDHCNSLQKKGVSAAYLGSAQPDKTLEDRIFL